MISTAASGLPRTMSVISIGAAASCAMAAPGRRSEPGAGRLAHQPPPAKRAAAETFIMARRFIIITYLSVA